MTARATMPRSLQIVVAFARLAWDWRRLRRRAPEKLPERLRQTLESLGTTFVKMGQGLSLRWDLLPAPFRHALESLHSDVPAFPSAQAVATVEAAFGLPIDRMFRAFDPQPLAAASVAQVHRAVLLDGREAIVKVTRPGVAEQVRADLRLLRRLVSVLQRFWPQLRRQRPLELVDELAAFLHAEIDMTHEARNMRRMATALAEVPGVTLPRVHERWVAPQVLVQELSHGRRIEEAYGTPRARELAHLLIDAYVHQFFGAGVFHGDPHPGNLFDLPDGRLCFHDFGTIGYLDAESRLAFAQLIESIAYDDAAGVLDASTTLGFLTARLDRRAYLRAISEVLSELTTLPLAQWSVAEVVWRVTRIGAGENLRLPRHLLVLLRTLFLLENTLRALDPELDLLAELNTRSPRILEVMERARAPRRPLASRMASAARQLPELLATTLRQARLEEGRPSLSVHHRGLEEAEVSLARTGNRLALAIITFGLYLTGSILTLHDAGPMLWAHMPVLAAFAYGWAIVLSLRLVFAVSRSGHL